MSIKAVEELIMSAVSDSDFRQRLESTPEEVISEFDLTVEEQEAIKKIQRRLSLKESELEMSGALLKVVPLSTWT